MEVEQIQRQRAKLYKDYLQHQINKHSQLKKYQSSYLNRKKNIDSNQLIKLLNDHDQERLKLRKNNAIQLKQENREKNILKNKSVSLSDSLFAEQKKHNSFTDDIHNMDEKRITKIKHQLAEQNAENSQQDQMRRYYRQHQKNLQRTQQQSHLRRNKQMQEDMIRNYEDIKRKHQQDMKLYNLHQSLINQNQEVKKHLQKFTETDKDVINPLYRNEAEQRRKHNRYNQEIIRKQMQQFKRRKSLQLQGYKSPEGSDLQKSIFRNILHHDSYDRKEYAQFLKDQRDIQHLKKNQQKSEIKKKSEIRGVFGGQYSPERRYQLQYIDKKLGLKHNAIPNQINTSRSVNVQSQPQLLNKKSPEGYQLKTHLDHKVSQKYDETSKNQTQYQQNSHNKKDITTTYQTDHSYYQPPPSSKQPVKHNDDYNKRYFKSYDLVSGRSKIYGYGP